MESKNTDQYHKEVQQNLEHILKRIDRQRKSVFARHPIIIGFASAFGVVCMFYGLEKILDSIPFFADSEYSGYLMFLTGTIILTITGSLFSKLQ